MTGQVSRPRRDRSPADHQRSLLIFHGLRPHQLRTLHVTDIVDGRLHIEGRKILLAPQARAALNGYLAHQERQWPNSGNPHLFINLATAGRLTPVPRPTGKGVPADI